MNFENSHFLGIDFGTKFVGLATFNPNNDPYPTPYDRIRFASDEQVCQEIKKVCKMEYITHIILGIPKLLTGEETNMSKRVREFHLKLTQIVQDIPVHIQDETLSSFEAEERMKNSPAYNFQVDYNKIDALAASIILEDFCSQKLELKF